MLKGVWSSDFHIGLFTDELNRTREIIGVLMHIAKYAVKKKADFVVFGGDIFHNNTPSEELISQFIQVLNVLERKKIRTFVMVGNHDAIAKKGRSSCLSFIRNISPVYSSVTLVDDIKTIRFKKAEVGDVFFTFLPFMYQAHINKKWKSVQQYVNFKMKETQKKLSKLQTPPQWYVFSHLNVKGVIPGTEEHMLKKVELVVPEFLSEFTPFKVQPQIINGHIHTRQKVQNNQIVGSPIFVDFGEKEESKYFLHMDIPEMLGEGAGGLKFIKTPCLPMVEFEIDNADTEILMKAVKGVKKKSIIKVDVTISDGAEMVDWEHIRTEIMKRGHFVKPIKPRVTLKRIKRNRKQTVDLNPKEASKVWLKSNKPKNAKQIYRLACDYVDRVL